MLAQVNSKLIARDIAERLGCWQHFDRRRVKAAIDRHGADFVWQLVDDALEIDRMGSEAPRRMIFFELLKQREGRRG